LVREKERKFLNFFYIFRCTLSTDLLQNKDNKVGEKSSNCNKLLFNRKLTIFAIAEERQINLTKRNKKQQRLRKCKFNGIEVIYVYFFVSIF